MNKSKHENFRQSFEEVHKHLAYQGMFNKFIETGKVHSMTFHSWNQYTIDVEIAFDYIYAVNAPDWYMRISAFAKILCYAFAYDHQNYSHWGQYTLWKCCCYQKLHHRCMNTTFQEGDHLVKRSENIYLLTLYGLIFNENNQLLKIRNEESEV